MRGRRAALDVLGLSHAGKHGRFGHSAAGGTLSQHQTCSKSMAAATSSDVAVTLYKARLPLLRLDVAPFAVIYALLHAHAWASLAYGTISYETLAGIPACVATMNGDREPGDFEFGGIFKPTDPVQLRRKQNAELKNGRLAMLAFSGQVTQAVLTGHDAPFLY